GDAAGEFIRRLTRGLSGFPVMNEYPRLARLSMNTVAALTALGKSRRACYTPSVSSKTPCRPRCPFSTGRSRSAHITGHQLVSFLLMQIPFGTFCAHKIENQRLKV